MPVALAGEQQGLSLLFPMEKLFESYVTRWLRKNHPQHLCLRAQAASEYLCSHDGRRIFQLRPDILMLDKDDISVMVMDTKWKRLETFNPNANYGLAESDFYQMLAYGQTYLKGLGKMALIYPAWTGFDAPLPAFDMGHGLRVEVLRFDLDSDTLCAPEGFWDETRFQRLPRQPVPNSAIPV